MLTDQFVRDQLLRQEIESHEQLLVMQGAWAGE